MSKLSQEEINALFAQYADGQVPPPEPTAPAPPASFPPLEAPPEPEAQADPGWSPAAPSVVPANISMLAGIEVEVTVRLGSTQRSIRDILSLGAGSVLQLDTLAGETVDILINGRMVAKGEVVVVGESYGVRIVDLVSASSGEVA